MLRTYLRTLLLLITSTLLFAAAVIAYTSFYYSYIPIRGLSVPVYLQFDHGAAQASQKWPHGVASLHGLVTRQKYDVRVDISVPRSRTNLDAGNWMLDLELRAPASSGGGAIKNILGWDESSSTESESTNTPSTSLAHARRPALLTYRSWPTEHLHRLLRLPVYLTGFGTESETLRISMLEGVYFHAAAPTSLRLELRSRSPLEVYTARVEIVARLEGLRRIMYKYRVGSAIVFIALFWATEMGVVVLTWGVFSLLFGSSTPPAENDEGSVATPTKKKIKSEIDPPSDTDRSFPTLSSHQALRYTSPETKVKNEEHTSLADIPLAEPDAEADDEEDDFVLESPVPRLGVFGGFTDSGLGTGMDSERERVRRRGRGKDEGGR